MTKSRFGIGVVLAFLAVVLFACNGNVAYEKNLSIEGSTWNSKDLKPFEYETTDTVNLYNMYLNLRNHKTYEFANLYVFFHTYLPNGTYDKDTLQFILADYQGKWQGKSSGEYVNNKVLFRRQFKFPEGGKYRFEIEQGMRNTELEGIADVGICIEKAK